MLCNDAEAIKRKSHGVITSTFLELFCFIIQRTSPYSLAAVATKRIPWMMGMTFHASHTLPSFFLSLSILL
jgi:hypothetical protein